ncbi:MAG TPA: 1,4-dihydroxy-2-naphthoate polyprenyltransferase, partial [Firmicutes bacterium]|nr:1,4-dihydroxy-2-naphthoate polyprenyltransferase [Bacillota bacterium]
MKKRLLLWIRAIRASFFSASVIPVIVGISTADHLGFESRWLPAAGLLGVLLLHAASNLAN